MRAGMTSSSGHMGKACTARFRRDPVFAELFFASKPSWPSMRPICRGLFGSENHTFRGTPCSKVAFGIPSWKTRGEGAVAEAYQPW